MKGAPNAGPRCTALWCSSGVPRQQLLAGLSSTRAACSIDQLLTGICQILTPTGRARPGGYVDIIAATQRSHESR
jgi:hypothetical protein